MDNLKRKLREKDSELQWQKDDHAKERKHLLNELEEYQDRMYRQQNEISNLEQTIEQMHIDNDGLLNDISGLREYIIDLERSLAEASLMSTTAN